MNYVLRRDSSLLGKTKSCYIESRLCGLEAAFRNGWPLSAKWLASRTALNAGNGAHKKYLFHVTIITRKLLLVLSKELLRTCAAAPRYTLFSGQSLGTLGSLVIVIK